jgi:DNA (cytosine-5)-methyltransferase 1
MNVDGLIVDLFAGGGGASVGIEAAIGRPVDLAINHDKVAMAVHKANHPTTQHLPSDIWEVRPEDATRGQPVDLLWASPDCTHFSVAKGGKPRKQKIRSLAWAVVRWAKAVRPRVIFLENVSEFRGWGPLGPDDKPDKKRMGETFKRWKAKLERLGYDVDYRILDASLYGAPTRRRRLFLVARCDGEAICWPDPTHGPGKLPFHTAAECIDWSIPCPSIFDRKKPLAEKTLWRIAQGIRRFVLENPAPFIVKFRGNSSGADIDEPLPTITSGAGSRRPAGAAHALGIVTPSIVKVNYGKQEARGEAITEPLTTVTATQRGHALVAPTLVQTSYGERKGQRPRYLDLHQPLGTVVAGGQKHALVSTFLAKHFGGHMTPGAPLEKPLDTVTARDHHALAAATLVKFRGNEANGHPGCAPVDEPMPTLTAHGTHIAEVRAFLTAYYGADGTGGQELLEPLRTITTKHRLGLVTIEGTDYQIVDIGMRMLQPHELLRAQFGRFAAGYDLSAAVGKRGKRTQEAQVRLIGNSVCPEVAEAVIAANLPTDEAKRYAA